MRLWVFLLSKFYDHNPLIVLVFFIVNFEHKSHFFLVFLLLTLNM